jgi:hypothetical protein
MEVRQPLVCLITSEKICQEEIIKSGHPSAKECWEFFFSSGPVIRKNSNFFWQQGFSEVAHLALSQLFWP